MKIPMFMPAAICALALLIENVAAQSNSNPKPSLGITNPLSAMFHLDQKRPRSTAPHNGFDAVALGLASARSFKFVSADFPGAEFSEVVDEARGVAVGDESIVFSPAAFTLEGDRYQLLTLSGAQSPISMGTNTARQIVGYYLDATNTWHGFLANDGTLTNIDDPAANPGSTYPGGINDAGQIVGYFTDSNGVNHGFFTKDGGTTFSTIDFPGATSTQAFGINRAEDISGQWTDAGAAAHGFVLKGGSIHLVRLSPRHLYLCSGDRRRR